MELSGSIREDKCRYGNVGVLFQNKIGLNYRCIGCLFAVFIGRTAMEIIPIGKYKKNLQGIIILEGLTLHIGSYLVFSNPVCNPIANSRC